MGCTCPRATPKQAQLNLCFDGPALARAVLLALCLGCLRMPHSSVESEKATVNHICPPQPRSERKLLSLNLLGTRL